MADQSPNASPFAMYVSSVEGHLVNRHSAGPHNPIGASFGKDGAPSWRPEQVHAITHAELAQHGREYRRALRENALKERTEADYQAYVKGVKERAKAAAAEAAAKELAEQGKAGAEAMQDVTAAIPAAPAQPAQDVAEKKKKGS